MTTLTLPSLLIPIAATAVLSNICFDGELSSWNTLIGSPAPSLKVDRWVKGAPVHRLQKGKVYVVEFWATWCKPCIAAMPHLAEVETRHKGAVEFIDIDVWEPDSAQIMEFMKKVGPKMSRHVGTDQVEGHTPITDPNEGVAWSNEHGGMSMTWLAATGVKEIPATFIVDKDGDIAWIGIPSEVDEPLDKVLAGTWNRADYAKIYAQTAADAEALSKLNHALASLKDFNQAIKIVDEYVAGHPSTRADMLGFKYQGLIKRRRFDEAKAVAEYALNVTNSDRHTGLPQIAWVSAFECPDKEPELGLKIALRADAMAKGQRTGVKESLARFYFLRREYAKAIEQEKAAISVSRAEDKAALRSRLAEYEKAAAGAGKTCHPI